MSTNKNNEKENVKIDGDVKKGLLTDYLAAYQQIKFSKHGDSIGSFRTLMAMKYHVAKIKSDELAIQLIDHSLDEYMDLMDNHEPFRSIGIDKLDFKSGLKSVEDIMQFIKPLSCQTDKTKSCKPVPQDRDVEDIVKYWNGHQDSPRRRKVSQSRGNDVWNTENSRLIVPSTSGRSRNILSTNVPSASSESSPNMARRQEKRLQFANLYKNYSKVDKLLNTKQSDEEEHFDGVPQKDERKMVPFKSARQLYAQQQKNSNQPRKTLGATASAHSKYRNPFQRSKEEKPPIDNETADDEDDRLKNIDHRMIELIRNEIMDSGSLITWNDVAGLEDAKRIIKEVIVFPMIRPDIFTGLRRPPKGMLLFGPPGTGKTLIGKCIASQSKSTFFSISASSLTSKWVGEGEKMVRALFAVARVHQPSVIFIDEIDSLLTQRSETEHESSRRIKTEFLVQLDGATTGDDDRILVIGATNRPQELDEAARRRFVKRLYVPLPEFEARKQIVQNLLANERHELTDHDIKKIATISANYSGADMTNLCKEASMVPIRSISVEQLENICKEDVRCVTAEDFEKALSAVRPSVSQSDLGIYIKWDSTYGSGTALTKST